MSHQPSEKPPSSRVDVQPRPYRFVIGAMFAVVTATVTMSMFAVSPVLPLIMDDYGINRGTAGLLTSVVPLMHVLVALPCSLLVGRLGPRTLVTLGALLASAPALSILASSFYILLLTRIVYGLSLALMMAAMAPLLMQRFRPSELSFMNGMFLASISLGVTISSFIAPRIATELGWQAALSLFGFASLAAALCWQLVMLREGKDAPVSAPRLPFRMFWEVLRSRTTVLLAAADAGPYALYTASLAWLPSFYHEVHGTTLEEGGALSGMISLTGVFTLLLASILTVRVHKRRPFLLLPGALAGFAGLGTILLAGTPGVYVAVIALGFVSWFYLPALLTIPMELPGTDETQAAVMLATLLSVGSIFTFAAPLVVGFSTDYLGTYTPGLALFAVLSWSLLVAGFLLPETGHRR